MDNNRIMEYDTIRANIRQQILRMKEDELKFASYLRIIAEIIKTTKSLAKSPLEDYGPIIISIMNHDDILEVLDRSEIDFIIMLARDKEMITLLTELLDWIVDARSVCLPLWKRLRSPKCGLNARPTDNLL